jgi:hypothetical protein
MIPLPKCRIIRHSLERAYAFPRVRLAVASLLLDSGMARPASQARARIVFDCRMASPLGDSIMSVLLTIFAALYKFHYD